MNAKACLELAALLFFFVLLVLLQYKWITQYSLVMNWCRSDFEPHKVKSKL